MRTIPLTQGKVAIVDEENYEELSKYKWHAYKSRSGVFYARRNGRRTCQGKRPQITMHRAILGYPDNFQIDHVSGDGLDNRKQNLRIATQRVNSLNPHVGRKRKHRLPVGVYPTAACQSKPIRYRSAVGVGVGRKIFFGTYDTPEEAGRVAAEYRQKLIAELSSELVR